MSHKYRDARTGAYVSEEYAKANPDTTVRENDGRVAELERRVAALEDSLSAALAQMTALSAKR